MYCKNCKQEISDNARFCTYCGADQTMVQNPMYQNQAQQYPVYHEQMVPDRSAGRKDFSSIILVAFAAIYFVTSLIQVLIIEIVNPWYYGETGWLLFYWLIDLVCGLSYIMIPLAIKKMPLKIAAFALITPLVLYYIFNIVRNIIELF